MKLNLQLLSDAFFNENGITIQATHFRIWATQRLKEYIIKGFTMDDDRLKDPRKIFGKDYFDEQLARIRDILAFENFLIIG